MTELHWESANLAWLYGFVALMVIGVILHFQWKNNVMRRLGDLPLIQQMTREVSPTAQWVRWVLIILAAVLVVTALLRPQYGTREAELANRGIDVVFVLDMSKSMMVRDVAPNRLKAAVAELEGVLSSLNGGRVGLVPFAGTAYTQTPLTTDFDAVRSYLNELRVEDMPIGGTRVGMAINHAMTVFQQPKEDDNEDDDLEGLEQPAASHFKAIVLISDGENHDEEAIKAAQAAANQNIRIFTVGIGSQSSASKIPVISSDGQRMGWVYDKEGSPIFSELNKTLLKDLADTTSGAAYIYGQDDVASGLTKSLDALEKKEYEHNYENLHEDRFQFVLFPALLFLIAETLIGDRRRKRNGRRTV